MVEGVRGLFSLVGTKSSCSDVKIVRNRNDCIALISDTWFSAICIWIDSSSFPVPISKLVNSAIFDINKKFGKSLLPPNIKRWSCNVTVLAYPLTELNTGSDHSVIAFVLAKAPDKVAVTTVALV